MCIAVAVDKPKAVVPEGTELDRDGDSLYQMVLSVVRAVTQLSRSLPENDSKQFVELVKVKKGKDRKVRWIGAIKKKLKSFVFKGAP